MMVKALQQGAMAATLALLSVGVFVLYDAFTRAHAAQTKSLVEGTALCCVALALLFALGTRDEK
jgi:multisubunit Na+/H+ antiporter MnhG subunit